MRIEVELFATLRKYGRGEEPVFPMDLADGDRVLRIIELLGIPLEMERVILVNGRPANLDSVLKEDDKVVIFPPVAGG